MSLNPQGSVAHTGKLDSGGEREAMLLNLPLASPLHGSNWYSLISGTGPWGLGFDFLGVELHAPRQGSQQKHREPGEITLFMASSHSGLWIAMEEVLPSLLFSLGLS